MKQQDFENRYQADWCQYAELLRSIDDKTASKEDLQQFSDSYRLLCQLSALAKERRYSPYLVDYLNDLVLKGHQRLYVKKTEPLYHIIRFVVVEFPSTLRQHYRFFWLACALFYFPLILMAFLVYADSELIFSVMPADQVHAMESMYDPTVKAIGRERQSDTDVYMFGFYIQNNIGVGFRTFAGGILFGLGSIFFLIFNGVSIGAVAGHLTHLRYLDTFYPFVSGHSSFELTAIVIAGTAGLMLGWALLAPGQLGRIEALKKIAIPAMKLIYGVIMMLTIAAFIEAFWSSNTAIPIKVKYAVAALLWGLVFTYLCFSGRSRPKPTAILRH